MFEIFHYAVNIKIIKEILYILFCTKSVKSGANFTFYSTSQLQPANFILIAQKPCVARGYLLACTWTLEAASYSDKLHLEFFFLKQEKKNREKKVILLRALSASVFK